MKGSILWIEEQVHMCVGSTSQILTTTFIEVESELPFATHFSSIIWHCDAGYSIRKKKTEQDFRPSGIDWIVKCSPTEWLYYSVFGYWLTLYNNLHDPVLLTKTKLLKIIFSIWNRAEKKVEEKKTLYFKALKKTEMLPWQIREISWHSKITKIKLE